jgi:hypothetical protein
LMWVPPTSIGNMSGTMLVVWCVQLLVWLQYWAFIMRQVPHDILPGWLWSFLSHSVEALCCESVLETGAGFCWSYSSLLCNWRSSMCLYTNKLILIMRFLK